MQLITSPGHPLTGAAPVPGDKSLSHRGALLSALANGDSQVDHFLDAGVTRPLLHALSSLGIRWDLKEDRLSVHGCGLRGFQRPVVPLDCGNSATVLRLLAGALAASGVPAVLDGSEGLRRRPMRRIVEPLAAMGTPIEASQTGGAPIVLHGRDPSQPLYTISYTLPVASAQVKSCLLLAALSASGPVTLVEPGPSRDHTERMLRSMGVEVESRENNGGTISITLYPPTGGYLAPLQLRLPGDFSSAAFLIVAALVIPGSSITLKEVGLNPTRTGMLDALHSMGAEIRIQNLREQGGEPVGDLLVRASSLQGVTIDSTLVVRMIDEFPAFTVAAAFARGITVVRDAQELRYKESDRISVLGSELRAIGVSIEETADGFIVNGGKTLRGGHANAHGDHRLAMALAIAGLAGEARVEIDGGEIIRESFPGFIGAIRALGGEISLEP